MKEKFWKFIPYAFLLTIIFYALPFLITDTGVGMLMLLLVMPLSVFILSLIYGKKQGFYIFLPFLVAILFAPTIFIFYNQSAWVYTAIYVIIAFVGNIVGRIFYKFK